MATQFENLALALFLRPLLAVFNNGGGESGFLGNGDITYEDEFRLTA